MNINNSNSLPGQAGVGQSGAARTDRAREAQQVQSRRTGGYGRVAGDSSDAVQLSELSRAVAAERPGSVERELRIASLKAAVQAGRYAPPGVEVAGRIVDDHLLKADPDHKVSGGE